MKHAAPLPAVLAVAALLLPACHPTPRQRWVQQREALSLTQDGLVFLHRRDAVSDDAFELATPWLRAARTENWKAFFTLDRDPHDANQRLDTARDLLRDARGLAAP